MAIISTNSAYGKHYIELVYFSEKLNHFFPTELLIILHHTGVGSYSLLQGTFPTQGSSPGLPQCRRILYCLESPGKPMNTGMGSLFLFQGIFPIQRSNGGSPALQVDSLPAEVPGNILAELPLEYSVQFSSVTQSCSTLCDPMNCSTPGLPVHHQLPESTQTHVH